METERIRFKSSKLTCYASELGLWTNKNEFIPMDSLQYIEVEYAGDTKLYVAYSAEYEWGYLNKKMDDLMMLIEKFSTNKNTYQATSDLKSASDSYDIYKYELENDRELEYSYWSKFRISFYKKVDEKRYVNKLELRHKMIDENFTALKTEQYHLTEKETGKIKDPIGKVVFDEFLGGEEDDSGGIAILLAILAIIIGIVLASFHEWFG